MASVRVETAPPALARRKLVRAAWKPSLKACWEYVLQMISLWRFILTGLVVSPLCAVILRLFGDHIPAATGQRLIHNLFASWLKFSQKIGVFEVSFPEGDKLASLRGAIIAANHPCQLDAVLLLIAAPRAVCIMRASLMQSPFLGGAARLARFVTNDSGPALVRQGIEKIRQGESLLIFPEGTRTRDQPVNSFKHGFALIAVKTGAPIQTVFIERENRYLAKGVSLMAPTPLPIRLRVHLGAEVRALPGESAQELSLRLEKYFAAHLENTGNDIRLSASRPF